MFQRHCYKLQFVCVRPDMSYISLKSGGGFFFKQMLCHLVYNKRWISFSFVQKKLNILLTETEHLCR